MIDVAPGTIVVFSDIACPWAHASVYRLLTTRHRLGLDDDLDAEMPVVGGLEPEAGWQVWQGPPPTWPVTTLPDVFEQRLAAASLTGGA